MEKRTENFDNSSGGHTEEQQRQAVLTWEKDIPLLGNPAVIKQMLQMLLFTGLLMAGLPSFVFLLTGEPEAIPSILVISLLSMVGFGILIFLIILIFFNNRFRVRYTIDEKGVLWETIDKRARLLNTMATVAGASAQNPSVAGAGLTGMSRNKDFTPWGIVARVEYHPAHYTINLRNSWRTVMTVVCHSEEYQQVADYIAGQADSPKTGLSREEKPANPLMIMFWRTFTVMLASVPVFTFIHEYHQDIFFPLIMLVFALATVWLVPLLGWAVIGSALFVAYEIFVILFAEKTSMFSWRGNYRAYEVFDHGDWFLLFLTLAGLTYLIWFSWSSIRGRIISALMSD